MMISKVSIHVLLACLQLIKHCQADEQRFRFAAYYGDHMVLQRAPYRAKLWGYAEADAFVSLTLFGKNYYTIARKVDWSTSYVWDIVLDRVEADNIPITIKVIQQTVDGLVSAIKIDDVLFGDVWMCGGQSNMCWYLINSMNGENEVKSGSNHTNIRLVRIGAKESAVPLNDIVALDMPWSLPSESTLKQFSAVCWYFGKELNKNLNVPIGLIQNCVDGTNIERWISTETFDICPTPRRIGDSTLWNAMVNPLVSLSIYGTIWYQGEANFEYNLNYYNCTFPALIDNWRNKWYTGTNGSTKPNFPFGFVQLANFQNEISSIGMLPWLRFHQTADFGYAPNQLLDNVFMASAVDLVDNYDNPLHPRYKEDVGVRLSLGAFNLGYNQSIEYSAPRVLKALHDDSRITIVYESVSDLAFDFHLKINSDTGFEVCCADDSTTCLQNSEKSIWQSLSAIGISFVDGSISFGKPVLCKQPTAIRYLWRQKPCEYKMCPLYALNSGLPFNPFIIQIKQKHKI